MAGSILKKRKAPSREELAEGSGSEDEIQSSLLNGALANSDSEDGSDDSSSEDEEADEFPEIGSDEEGIDSDEVPSSDQEAGEKDEEDEDEDDGEEAGEVDEHGRKTVLDSAGNLRYIYPEIDTGYASDDSDREEVNTVGNIDLSLYEEYPHVGYDINGKKIMRPAKGAALDALLDTIEVPKGWTGMVDKNTGGDLKLTREELEILRKIQMDEVPVDGYDPYAPTIEYFTSKLEVMPLSAAPEPKRRFVPSKHEAKRVMKIVKAIREGRIVPNKPKEPEKPAYYDIWANEVPREDHIMHIPAPKLPPPTHDESYNPPEEYLPTPEEKKKWEEEDPEDREKDYLPRKSKALRLVPGYDRFINERFERCLDLYLAPRVRRNKLNIDPESLLPKLPSPQDLRPFPTTTATVYRGHEGRVRTLNVDPTGVWLATGGDDGTVRIWEILTGREVWKIKLADKEAVNCIKWRPVKESAILAAAAGDDLYLMVPPIFDPETEIESRKILEHGYGTAANATKDPTMKEPPGKWTKPIDKLTNQGAVVMVTVKITIKHIAWHRRGDYVATTSPEGQNRAVAIHQLSRHTSQSPFRKSKGIIQRVEFHPFRPILFVATQRYIRSYDLSKQELMKTLQPGARWISSFDVHSGGDNIIVGAYDKRLLWHDLELSTKPYRTLRYHEKAIRAVKYHQGGYPLFVSASDDGTIQVFHGKVFADMMENPLIVPLKILKGHKVTQALGVLDVDWHPKECWLFSAGADGTARLWN
ncbi:NUC169 domain-containing protein [Trichophaea hybrida]|nr:NUC169 domain-containing protein [Trichophaea hybrida]